MLLLITLRQTKEKLNRSSLRGSFFPGFRLLHESSRSRREWNLFIYLSQSFSLQPFGLDGNPPAPVKGNRLMDAHKRPSSALRTLRYQIFILFVFISIPTFFSIRSLPRFFTNNKSMKNSSGRGGKLIHHIAVRDGRDTLGCVHRTAYVFTLSFACIHGSHLWHRFMVSFMSKLLLEQKNLVSPDGNWWLGSR